MKERAVDNITPCTVVYSFVQLFTVVSYRRRHYLEQRQVAAVVVAEVGCLRLAQQLPAGRAVRDVPAAVGGERVAGAVRQLGALLLARRLSRGRTVTRQLKGLCRKGSGVCGFA